jgi:hypothetical protein
MQGASAFHLFATLFHRGVTLEDYVDSVAQVEACAIGEGT